MKSIEIANTETGEVMAEINAEFMESLPEIMRPKTEQRVLIPSNPLDIRTHFQGHDGYFTIGQSESNEGKELVFHLFNVKNFDNIQPSEQYRVPSNFTQFIGLAYYKGRAVWSTLTFSGTSAMNARDILPILDIKGGSIANILRISTDNASNKSKDKFTVAKFDIRTATKEEIENVKLAVTTNPNCTTGFRNIPDINSKPE